MSTGDTRIVVIIRSGESARVAEALRAALGLSLRGDPVEVVALGPAASHVLSDHDPVITRARRTLGELGHTVRATNSPTACDLGQLVRMAHAVEVWT